MHQPVVGLEGAVDAPATGIITSLLLQWQQGGDDEALAQLVVVMMPAIRNAAGRMLRRHGIRDTSTVDDTLCLVLDNIRRLKPGPHVRSPLAAFVPDRSHAVDTAEHDAGMAWIQMLTRSRALDMIRMRRRRASHMRCFSELACCEIPGLTREDDATPTENVDERHCRLMEAIAQLEPRARLLIELLLEGKTQATAAHVLDVCEGTISRMLRRIVIDLRGRLAAATGPVNQTPPSAGHEETPAPRAPAARPARARVSPRRGRPGPSAPA
jgi:RNA polymerase sigma factor (sigma-70 family)